MDKVGIRKVFWSILCFGEIDVFLLGKVDGVWGGYRKLDGKVGF